MRILLLFLVVFPSCEGGKEEFVESKAIEGLVLVTNLSQSSDKVKKAIIEYIKNQKGKDFMEFYEYSTSTKAFIESKRVGGYLREYIHLQVFCRKVYRRCRLSQGLGYRHLFLCSQG